MSKFIVLIAMLVFPVWVVAAEQAGDNQAVVVQTENKSVFKGLLYKVWGRLRAYSPKTVRYRNRAAVTAGIRGTETTTSLIKPYWKDDLTEDPVYQKQLQEFSQAQQLAENGDLDAAAKALSAFIDTNKDSDLKANALFALGITYGGLGDNSASVSTLNSFVNDNPEHPLAVDAKQVIAELQ